MEFVHSEEFCHNFLKNMFWGENRENKKCPHCGSCNVNEFKDFKKNRCYDCKFEFSIRKNTIFDDSKVSLKKWFMVIYLARQIGVTQKTSWFMLQRIKSTSVGAMFKNEFEGTVEIDEAYIGGSESNRHAKDKKENGEPTVGGSQKPKTVVLGMVNRETGCVKAMKVPTAEKDFLLPKINLNVKQGSTIVTDTYHAYKDLKKNYKYKSVKHSAGEYVRIEAKTAFKVHTNSVEGFWSLVKRTINGTHHWICLAATVDSKTHNNKYLAEMSFRYNTKELSDSARFVNFLQISFKKLTYKDLISA